MSSRTRSAALAAGLALTTALTLSATGVTGASAADDGDTPRIIGGTNATEAYPFAARLLTAYTGLGLTGRCSATLVTYRTLICKTSRPER